MTFDPQTEPAFEEFDEQYEVDASDGAETLPPLSLRVLLFDDDESELTTVGMLLEEADVAVEPVVTVEEVHTIVGDVTPEMPILLLMAAHAEPGAGLRVMQELAADPTLRARMTVVDIARALGHLAAIPLPNADRVIEAPLSPKALVALIHEYPK